jgi:hypothetical protein
MLHYSCLVYKQLNAHTIPCFAGEFNMSEEFKQLLKQIQSEEMLNKVSGMEADEVNAELKKIDPALSLTAEQVTKLKNELPEVVKKCTEAELDAILNNVSGGSLSNVGKFVLDHKGTIVAFGVPVIIVLAGAAMEIFGDKCKPSAMARNVFGMFGKKKSNNIIRESFPEDTAEDSEGLIVETIDD